MINRELPIIIRIAFVQLIPGKSIEDNLAIRKKACIEAKEKGADIALFPEMRNDRYYLPQDENEIKTLSVEKNSRFIEEFRRVNELNRKPA